MLTGIYNGVSAAKYHALPHVSASLFRKYHTIVEVGGQTPRHVQIALQAPFVPTWQTILGTLVHQLTLEPGTPFPQIALEPLKDDRGEKWAYRTDANRKWKSDREAEGKIVMKPSDLKAVDQITSDLYRTYPYIFRDAETEQTLVYGPTEFGILKARIDCNPPGPGLFDIKTCADASDRAWDSDAYKRGLHMQAALYLDMWNALNGATNPKTEFTFVCVENSAPFASRLRKCSEAFIARGREDNGRWMRLHMKYVTENLWPGYEDKTLDAPRWVSAKEGVE